MEGVKGATGGGADEVMGTGTGTSASVVVERVQEATGVGAVATGVEGAAATGVTSSMLESSSSAVSKTGGRDDMPRESSRSKRRREKRIITC